MNFLIREKKRDKTIQLLAIGLVFYIGDCFRFVLTTGSQFVAWKCMHEISYPRPLAAFTSHFVEDEQKKKNFSMQIR